MKCDKSTFEAEQRFIQRLLFAFECEDEISVHLVLGVLKLWRPVIKARILQFEIDLRRKPNRIRRRRDLRRQSHLYDRRRRASRQDQFASVEKYPAKFSTVRVKHFAKPLVGLRRAFLHRLVRDGQGGAIQTRPAVMTINALRLVFMPALWTNKLGHAADSFFGLLAGVVV